MKKKTYEKAYGTIKKQKKKILKKNWKKSEKKWKNVKTGPLCI
jgi:hypothetical protein